ncbi:MAG: fructose-6-phosphate aldolase [Chloroherpetonaceae bacterium]
MKVYLLKTKGKGVVPDYIQVRDENQSIIGYFKASNIEKGLDEIRLDDPARRKAAAAIFEKLEFGKMIQAEL